VLSYLVRLADVLDVDLEAAVEAKLKVNAHKYPVDLAYGSATIAAEGTTVRHRRQRSVFGC
jgi:hypothetical protein